MIFVFIMFIILILGVIEIKRGFFFQIVSRTKDNRVLLTFDDGPHEKFTPQILDILADEKVKAVFFCIGKNMEAQPELVKRILREGHILGNHSYTHSFWIDFGSKEQWKVEIQKTNGIANSIGQKRIRLFRPPYGVSTPKMTGILKDEGMTVIGWTLRSFDTTTKSANTLIQRIESKVQAGDIILLHDTQDITVQSLSGLIQAVKNKGIEFGQLEESLSLQAYA